MLLKRLYSLSVIKRDNKKEVDDSWKWTSNYFKDHWNRETFGPKLVKNSNISKRSISDKDGQFWTLNVEAKKRHIGLRPQSELEQAIVDATAAISCRSSSKAKFEVAASEHSILRTTDKTVTGEASEFSYKVNPLLNLHRKPLDPSDLTGSATIVERGRNESKLAGVPSVTSILRETMPVKQKLALQAWEERMVLQMGRDAFDKMQASTLRRGRNLHSALESYFTHGSLEIPTKDISDTVSVCHLESIKDTIGRFERPAYALESQVYHSRLNYKGYMDAVAFYGHNKKKKLVLVDWKTSAKEKLTLAATFEAPIQVAAYVGALNHDPRYAVQVAYSMLVIVYNDGRPATAINMSTKQLEKYWTLWLQRLQLYNMMMAFNDGPETNDKPVTV